MSETTTASELNPEPTFAVYRKDNHPELGDPPYNDEKLDIEALDPDRTFSEWDALDAFLDDTGEYVWREFDNEDAPVVPLCPNRDDCDVAVKTWSKQRVQYARQMHHIGSGH